MPTRIALCVEYDGSRYNGWQAQHHGHGVQEEVERALSKVANHPVKVVCAGRTDTGVHALGQIIHFDSAAPRGMRAWVFGANANLPKDISVVWAHPVSEEFHARYSALWRRYRYVIFNRDVRPAVLAHKVSWEYRPLDEARMTAAARYLTGEHDFSSYRALRCQAKNPRRTVEFLKVRRVGDVVYFEIQANAFLHHMVRNIAGVLMSIGAGEHDPEWAADILALRDRTQGGVTAPPDGLYFLRAAYDEKFGLPAISEELPFAAGFGLASEKG